MPSLATGAKQNRLAAGNCVVSPDASVRSTSPQPAHQLRRRDGDEFGRRPSQADVEELVPTRVDGGMTSGTAVC